MISSSEALPARSPIPLMQPSTCRTPVSMAVRLLATASPRSLWQWTLRVTFSMPGTLAWMSLSSLAKPLAEGIAYPTVSAMFMVLAPARITSDSIWYRYSGLVRVASMGENSTSGQ